MPNVHESDPVSTSPRTIAVMIHRPGSPIGIRNRLTTMARRAAPVINQPMLPPCSAGGA